MGQTLSRLEREDAEQQQSRDAPRRGNTPEQEEAVRIARGWYERDKNAKRFYIDEMKEMYKLYKGDHWDLLGPGGQPLRTEEQQKNRPNSVENITFALVEGTASEFAQDVELLDYPVEKSDEDAATTMTELKKFIMRKNRIEIQRIKFLRWFFLYGTGIWHIYWDPDWKGGRGPNRWHGDIRWQAIHPLMLVPDARCKEDINEGNRCHKVVWRTMESLKEQYPDRYPYIEEQSMAEDDLLDTEPEVAADGEGTTEYNQEQVPVIETWYVGEPLILDADEKNEGPGLHVIWWAGEYQGVYLRHTNYIYFDPDETPKFPFVVKQCYPRENSIWGFGEAYFLKNPQIIMNKTSEIILEGHLHQAVGQTFYRTGALTPKQQAIIQKKGTLAGMWFEVQDESAIRREYSRGVPSSLQNEMGRLQKVMEAVIGRPDISQGRTPGSVTAFRAIAELNARAQVRLRIKEMTITSSYEECGTYINRLISQFYNEHRKFRILGPNGYEYRDFWQEDILRVYDFETGRVLRLADVVPPGMSADEAEDYLRTYGLPQDIQTPTGAVPEAVAEEAQLPEGGGEGAEPSEPAEQEDRFEIYFPEFDTYCKVTAVLPSDRIYNMEMAKELLIAKLIDPETFLHVMEHGRFPPYEELVQRLQQRREVGGMSAAPGQAEVAELIAQYPPEVQELLMQSNPESVAQFLSLPPEQQEEVLAEAMQAEGR